jgi:excinuclease ABC subunit C
MDCLNKTIINLPTSPGVYQFINSRGEIIYIGKAKNIKSRVSSYFNKKKYDSFKTKIVSQQVVEIRHLVVESETDALLLENNLIKKHQPKYNILLKDDKTFPWLCIKNESFPRLITTRRFIKDGSNYFGPYTSVLMVNTLLGLIRQIYQLRTCKFNLTTENIENRKVKKCLEYHIGNCKAPCEKLQTNEDYQISILQIKDILKGNIQNVIENLSYKMKDYANSYMFEEAEKIKQKIFLLQRYKSKSTIVSTHIVNLDVFSFIENDKSAYVNFLKVINGAIVQSHTVELIKKLDENASDLLLFAILDIREKVNSNAREVLVPFLPNTIIPDINFCVPKLGDKKKLLELSERNAKQFLSHKIETLNPKMFESKSKIVLEKAKIDLRLVELPVHIECFDNSNIQGKNPVAACVVFKEGRPSKKDYRHYNIKTVEGPDDFASMGEVVFRRYSRLIFENQSLPQLVIIDGGKGQLNAAIKSLKQLNIYGKIAVIGIAKRLEELYFPNDSIPLYLDKKTSTLKLIQNLRNEAHRFGIAFHRDKRSKTMLRNSLEDIKGIGKTSVEKLLKEFGSINSLREKKVNEIEQVVGKKIAMLLVEYFQKSN